MVRFYVDKTNKTGIKIPWDKTSVWATELSELGRTSKWKKNFCQLICGCVQCTTKLTAEHVKFTSNAVALWTFTRWRNAVFSFYFALHSSLNVRLWKIQLCYKWKVLHSSRKTCVCEVKNYRSNFIAPTELFCGCKCHCVIFLVWGWFWWNFQREWKPPRCHMIIVPKWNWNKCKISTVNEYIVCT